jgi:hypothetical protein
MSFPGSYNIRYYYGDTLEFRIFPKNASGEIFDLSTFTEVKFTLAPNRNTPIDEHITCFAQISSDSTNILCTIRPEDSENINPDLQYVYDVEVSKTASPYDIVYTLLTGSVTVVRDVTRPDDGPPPVEVPVPSNPTNLALVDATTSSLEVSWTPSAGEPEPDFYKVAILPFTTDSEAILQAITNSTTVLTPQENSFIFSDLDLNTEYIIIVAATNIEDVFDPATILTNEEPFSTLDVVISPEFPNNPEELTFTSATETTMTVGWQPPSEGIDPSAFKLAIIPFTTDTEALENAVTTSTNIVSGSTFSRTFTGLAPGTEYSIVIVSLDSQGDFNLENLLTNDVPFSTAAESVEPPPEPDFFITNDGSGAYLIDGVSNDTITLVRGQTYVFELDASGHPFWIQSVPAPYNAQEVYNDGIDGNGTAVGIITWTVSQEAPSTLYYVCQFHSAMSGTILIIDDDNEEYES